MEIKIDIACDNAAFQDGNFSTEVRRMLLDVANNIEGYEFAQKNVPGEMEPQKLRDINGNVVGSFEIIY